MKGNKNTCVDIEFEADVFPPECAAGLLISTIEYLLFQRRQIPFVFPTFKYMTSKWTMQEDNTYEMFHLEKQRRLALSTLSEVNALCEHLKTESKCNTITSARVIFGATPLTPKEVYIIKLPKVCNQHRIGNHRKTTDLAIHKVLMFLLTCEKLYHVFSANIGVTNMYLEIATQRLSQNNSDNFQIKESNDFSAACRVIHINLIRKQSEMQTNNCCRNIKVFDTVGEMNICENDGSVDDGNQDVPAVSDNLVWKEAKIFVRGFKDVFVRGRNIWED